MKWGQRWSFHGTITHDALLMILYFIDTFAVFVLLQYFALVQCSIARIKLPMNGSWLYNAYFVILF